MQLGWLARVGALVRHYAVTGEIPPFSSIVEEDEDYHAGEPL
jgi:hypothetical protein